MLEFDIVLTRRIDHAARFEKNRERALKVEATYRANSIKRTHAEAQREVQQLEEQLCRAKERMGA